MQCNTIGTFFFFLQMKNAAIRVEFYFIYREYEHRAFTSANQNNQTEQPVPTFHRVMLYTGYCAISSVGTSST